MRFKVKLRTSGGKREVELPATSIQDAIDQAKDTYSNCTILGVDLAPERYNKVIIFVNGGIEEIDRTQMYVPFKP